MSTEVAVGVAVGVIVIVIILFVIATVAICLAFRHKPTKMVECHNVAYFILKISLPPARPREWC